MFPMFPTVSMCFLSVFCFQMFPLFPKNGQKWVKIGCKTAFVSSVSKCFPIKRKQKVSDYQAFNEMFPCFPNRNVYINKYIYKYIYRGGNTYFPKKSWKHGNIARNFLTINKLRVSLVFPCFLRVIVIKNNVRFQLIEGVFYHLLRKNEGNTQGNTHILNQTQLYHEL